VDRDAIARGRRREQALEALQFERDREQALVDQIASVVLEEEGPRVDAEAFGRMDPADLEIVRGVLDDSGWAFDEEEPGSEADDDGGVADDAGEEDEIARLEGELAGCRHRQRALERYMDALTAPREQP
jgi:hypothetical protein